MKINQIIEGRNHFFQEYDPWFDLAPEDCEPGYCYYDSYRRFVAIKDR